MTTPRIFVQIASYRDPELQHTIQDLYSKAAKPERIFAGICWQGDRKEDAAHFAIPYKRPEQIRTVEYHYKDSKGACWARKEAHKLWRGEEYILNIDAHMRFEQGWDEALIGMLRACPSEKAMLTVYAPPYTTPPDHLERGYIIRMRFDRFADDPNGTLPPKLFYNSERIEDARAPAAPFLTATVSHNFMFAPAALFTEVPIDPHIYFFGDDLTYAARAWTHGWDIYTPNRTLIYHLWDRKDRRGHWDDHASYGELNVNTDRRAAHLMRIQRCGDASALVELDQYGFGSARSFEDYMAFSGVDFIRKTLSPVAQNGGPYAPWQGMAQHASASLTPQATGAAATPPTPPASGGRLKVKYMPKKVYESAEGIVYDDFLPEEVYEEIYRYMCTSDFEYINTHGKVSRAWHIRDGFPLRGLLNLHYFPVESEKPQGDWVYPTGTALDKFAEALNSIMPEVQHFIGKPGVEWDRYSVTPWLYPPGTALSLHDDGSGVYAGAYAYFINPYWNIHWGGLLLLLDPATNQAVKEHRAQPGFDNLYFHQKKWLDDIDEQALMWEPGFARCVFPKRNRIAFINNESYHLVTKVNPEAGDNVRMSLAGFFGRRR